MQEKTSWNQFWDFLCQWGRDIIELFKMLAKSITNIFLATFGDLISSVKILGQEFKFLGDIIWDA